MAPILQDMPPEGGYQKIVFHRIPAKSYFNGYTLILAYLGATFGGLYIYGLNRAKVRRLKIEARSARLAIEPILRAEKDREFLKQLRRNRDEEAKLMANVEGWQVGKYNGESLFKTLPPDTLVSPTFLEYYAHTTYKEYYDRATARLWA